MYWMLDRVTVRLPVCPGNSTSRSRSEGIDDLSAHRQAGGIDEIDAIIPLVGGCDPFHQGLDLPVRQSLWLHLGPVSQSQIS